MTGQYISLLLAPFLYISHRYALGCWTKDAYVQKYNLPDTGCNGVPDSSTFYTDSGAIADVWIKISAFFKKID